jgi:hypothetical protein
MTATVNASTSAGVIVTSDTSGALALQTAGTTALTISSAQAITMAGRTTNPTTISVGNATPSTSGSGITFPATVSLSSDANTLDDYEEGIWTPVLIDNLNNSATMTYQEGFYTKTGNIVNVWAQVRYSSVTALASGSYFRFSGLPFTSKATNGGYYYCGATQMSLVAYTGSPVGCNDAPSTQILFFNATGGLISPTYLNSSGYIDVSLTYFTSL